MPASRNIHTPIQLYRYLQRVIRKLPEESRDYYRHNVRQQFISHNDEVDPQRIQQILERAVEDSEWILKKYTKPKS